MKRVGILLFLSLFAFKGVCESQKIFTSLTAAQMPSFWRLTPIGNLTYASEYVTDGFRVGEGKPVLQPSLTLINSSKEYWISYWTSLQTNRELRQFDEHDAMIGFNHNYLPASRYAFNFHTFYDYWFYPNSRLARDKFGDQISAIEKHGGKVQVGVSMYNLLPFADSFLIPSYNVNYWIYWQDDRRDKYQGGARHEFLLQYHRVLRRYLAALKNPFAGASASLNYNDGAFGVRSGWSHSTGSIYTGFDALGVTFTVSMNQQWTYQSTVNSRNEFWTTLSLTKAL